MKLLKLSAISSTNDYLKELLTQSKLENCTVVVTDYQVSGKGQGTNKWHSEKGKNLLFSLLLKFEDLSIHKSAYLNFAIAIGIYQVLESYLPKVKIKWPNDIMAEDQKICGILIENSISGSNIKYSIIGIGLNVNQCFFPKELVNVTSFFKILNKESDKELLLKEIINSINKQVELLLSYQFELLKFNYEQVLFRNGIFSPFAYFNGETFFGTIVGVSKIGLLQIKMADKTVKEFANKEIVFINQ